MTIHSNDTSSIDAHPAVYVDKLSFRYRSPDDDPNQDEKQQHLAQRHLTNLSPSKIFPSLCLLAS